MSEDDNTCDITPSTELLFSWRSQRLSRAHVLGELLDNSFDWGASSVKIEIAGRDLIVEDDGDGCGDLTEMLTAGRSSRSGRARVGRFGVGLKDSAIWLGGTTSIKSVHRGVVRSVIADWDAIARSSKWKIPRPREQKAEPGERGTRIVFAGIIRDMSKDLEALIAEIGYLFSPAIKSQRQIIFRQKNKPARVTPRFTLPEPLENRIDTTIMVDGKKAHVWVGVVPEGVNNPKPGISYTHLHRVIIPACGLGCGGRNYSRISGIVALDGGEWKLNKNKDGVNVDEDLLADAVYSAIKDVVDRGARQSLTIQSASLANNLTTMLRGMLGGCDATRDRTGDKTGTINPKNTNRKHTRSAKGRDGSSRLTVNAGRMSIGFQECDHPLIGRVDLHGHFIWLAENNPWVARLRETENADALLGLAMSLLADASKDPNLQQSFRFPGESGEMSFEKALGILLREQDKPILKVVAA